MRADRTERFKKQYNKAPRSIKAAVDKQLLNLERDLRHPSIQAKKYDDASGVWQGRATLSWRFYFLISGDSYLILSLIPHPK